MRTTVNLDPSLLHDAKRLAAQRRCSLGRVIDDALRACLAAESDRAATAPVEIRTFVGQLGLRPGVDLEDRAAMAQVLGDDAFPRPR